MVTQKSGAGLTITDAGMFSSIQDFGRFGLLAQGYTRGGPVDELSFLWANRLLGNDYNAAQVEITLGGFKATIEADTYLAITGATADVKINEVSAPQWQVLRVKAGDQLSIGYASAGLRLYLAVAGGFAAPLLAGSCATIAREGTGGLREDGSGVRAGDSLAIASGALKSTPVVGQHVKPEWLPEWSSKLTLQVLPSGQHAQFSAAARQRFFQQSYQVTDKSDRMGVRLQGPGIDWQHAGIASEPLVIGAIQVPTDGQPIIMLNDRQTLGGYPKIGVLSWDAKNQLAQAQPGTQVQFREATAATIRTRLISVYGFFGVACQRAQNLRS